MKEKTYIVTFSLSMVLYAKNKQEAIERAKEEYAYEDPTVEQMEVEAEVF